MGKKKEKRVRLTTDPCISQIPPTISWICVVTCHIYLFVALLLLLCKQLVLKILGLVLVILYTTSFTHWTHPLFYTFSHYADLFMVFVSISYGTYAMYCTSKLVFTIWAVCLLATTIIFITNEVLYYYQVKIPKNILESDPGYIVPVAEPIKNSEKTLAYQWNRYFSLKPTWPHTNEREYAYYRSTITHAFGVHLITGGIAGVSIALICLMKYQ